MLPPYQNEPVTDFSRPKAQDAFKPALETMKQDIGKSYPLVINGEALYLDKTFPSINPALPAEVGGGRWSGVPRRSAVAESAGPAGRRSLPWRRS